MRILCVLLLMFLCVPARAATMCVPDLSTCDSCTEVSSDSTGKWVADCCGVRVSGIAFYALYNLFVTESENNSMMFGGYDLSDFIGKKLSVCFMTEPVVAPYFHLISNYELNGSTCCVYCSSGTGGCVYHDGFSTNAAKICSKAFKPVCAYGKCSETLSCNSSSCGGGFNGGGAD